MTGTIIIFNTEWKRWLFFIAQSMITDHLGNKKNVTNKHTYTSSWYISSSTSLSWPSERGDCSFIAQSLITPSSPDQDWLPGERSLAQNCFSLLDFQIFKLSIKESHLSALKEKHSKMDPIFRQFFSSQNFVVQKIISNRWIKTNINASSWLT